VTDGVLPSQIGSQGFDWVNQSLGFSEVDQMFLRPASVEARWALCIMAMGHFYMGPSTHSRVAVMSVFHHYGLIYPRIVSTGGIGGY
jgi:hypothetical protein